MGARGSNEHHQQQTIDDNKKADIMTLLTIYVTLAVIVLFGLCIFIHELGHFLAAKALGMVIDVFSIGFGPAIWKKKIGGVLFKIGIFPLGGYVALPQMDPTGNAAAPIKDNLHADGGPAASSLRSRKADFGEAGPRAGSLPKPGQETVAAERDGHLSASAATETLPDQERVLPKVAPWKKIIVAVAGAGGNILLAYIIAWIIFIAGKPSTPAERCAIIGFVDTNSAAYARGLRPGDEILAINGRAVNNWQDVIQENARFEEVELLLKTPAATNSIAVQTEKNSLGFRMITGLREIMLCKVMAVEPDSSAEAAGIQSGDLIRTFDGAKVLSIDHLIALTSERAGQTVPVGVERDGKELIVNVTPRLDPALGRARIGIRFDPMAVDTDLVVHIAPGAQIKSHALVILRVLRSLMTPKEAKATSQALGGPLMIIYMLQDMVRKGIIIALWFTCLLNVNLAILNLFPLPVLDGGHVVFALLEIVTRRPVPPKVALVLDQIFFVLLIGLIILISGRDVKRLYQIRLLTRPPAEKQAVTNAVPAPEATTNGNEQ
jgi:regulator of sigma E protease